MASFSHQAFPLGKAVRSGDAAPEFQELHAPEDNEVVELAALVAGRIRALLKHRGVDIDASEDNLFDEEPGLAALHASSVRSRIAVGSNIGQRVAKLGDQIDGDSLDALQSPRCATQMGLVYMHVSGCERKPDRAQP